MNFTQNKGSRGYTLHELIVVVAIMGIIAALSVGNVNALVLRQKAQIGAVGFFKEFQSLPALVRKSSATHFIQFSAISGAATYKVYKDNNGDGSFDRDEDTFVQVRDQPNLVIGRGTVPSGSSPATWISTAVIHDNWKLLGTSGADVITCHNDITGSIRSGHVYFYSDAYPSVVYCVAVQTKHRSVQIFQWNGGSWKEM